MADITIPRSDYGYYLNFLVRDSDGNVYNLTGYTITLKVWRVGIPGLIMSGACPIVEAGGGVCRYLVQPNDFNRVGSYLLELELTKAGVVESTQNYELEVEASR